MKNEDDYGFLKSEVEKPLQQVIIRESQGNRPGPFHRFIYMMSLFVGGFFGWKFGSLFGGMLLGIVLALVGAIVASTIIGAIATYIFRYKP